MGSGRDDAPAVAPCGAAEESSRRPIVRTTSLVRSLSELAARVQRGRTVDEVIETAGRGVLALGMRLGAFQVDGDDLVLRYVATSPSRREAIEGRIGRPLCGLRVRAADQPLVLGIVVGRRVVFREDLGLFDAFLRTATGFDASALDQAPETAGVTNGVLAPIFVADRPWGILAVYSEQLTRDDGDAVALFATHVGSALEVAESLEALQRAQRELVKRERLAALGELAAVVAHEVRNPLGVLFNTIAELRTIVSAGAPRERLPDATQLLGMAAEEADRLNRIVGDLLAFARPNDPLLRPTRIEDVFGQAAASTGTPERFVLEVDPELPLVAIDERLVTQAVLNLAINGLQAMPGEGTLTLRARLSHDGDGRAWARLDVVDHGSGVPADVREILFEPFVTTKAAGTGLGLAIVKRIVEAHHGEIAMTSGAEGTTFTLLLPVEHAPAPRRSSAPPRVFPSPPDRATERPREAADDRRQAP